MSWELVKIVPAPKGSPKKYEAYFQDKEGKTKKTGFGARGYLDYTQHKSVERRSAYRKRHEKDLKTKDPTKAGYLSYYILWGDSTSLRKNIADYRKKFRL